MARIFAQIRPEFCPNITQILSELAYIGILFRWGGGGAGRRGEQCLPAPVWISYAYEDTVPLKLRKTPALSFAIDFKRYYNDYLEYQWKIKCIFINVELSWNLSER